MTYIISHETHPNNETRLTLYKKRGVFLSLKERAAKLLGVSTAEVVALTASVSRPSPHLTFVPNSEPPKHEVLMNSHRRTAFGKSAVTRIFRAAGALDRFDSECGNYLFLTATLPGNTDESKWAIAEYAHEVIDGLKSWLSKRLLDRKEFYVWENQSRGALHFHYCIYCPNKEVQAEIAANFKAQMVRLYNGIDEKYHCNLWGKHQPLGFDARTEILQARVEVVYKSVGSYMAGYLGGKDNKHSRDHLHRYYPKRWFGVSRPLSALIDSYTEKEQHEFTSLKEAYEFYHATKEEILDDAVDTREFQHKIGEGKTFVAYHTLEKQQELWQARKSMNYNHNRHPVINAYVCLALRTTLELRQCLQRFKSLAELLPPRSVQYLQDSISLTYLRNGKLSQQTIKELEVIFSSYDFSSSSQATIRRCFNNLVKFNLQTARFYPQMRFNSMRFLSNPSDFEVRIDITPKSGYVRTNTETVDTPNALDGSSARVASELGASFFEQLDIWSRLRSSEPHQD